MKIRFAIRAVVTAVAFVASSQWAHAAITCSVSSPGFSAYYLPTEPVDITQSSVTVSCNRALPGDPASLTYFVGVDDGSFPGGGSNRATGPGSGVAARINYDTYKDGACAAVWTLTGGGRITGTITFAGTGVMTRTQSWWGCIPTGQTGKNAGTFTDTVTMTLTVDAGTVVGAPFTFPVSIVHPANCTISPLPADLNFSYTSFAASPSTANTSFGLNCTNSMPYTMSLNAYGGTLLGLNYTLNLNGGVLSGTGTGAAVTIPIAGTIAAGQAGACAAATCNAAALHTLTITY